MTRQAEAQTDEYEITGVVKGRDNAPLSGARVAVWWQRLRDRKELAAGTASELGRYRLRYKIPEQAPRPLLLVVEALSEYLDAPLFSPQVQAQPSQQVDLGFEPVDMSEWTALVGAIQPFLGEVPLAALVENDTHRDISFLAAELLKSSDAVMRVGVAARLEAAFKIPAPVFYAFLRQQVPAALPNPLLDASGDFTLIDPLVQSIAAMIFGLSPEVQTQTLTAAIALDYIGAQFTPQIAKLVAALQAQQAGSLLNQPYLVGNTTLAQLLGIAGLGADQQQAFAAALASNNQSMRGFWRTLSAGQAGLTAAEASAVERTLSIGAFVKNFVPLVEKLTQAFAAGTYKSLFDLARLSKQDWINLVNQTGAPPNIDATATASAAEVFAAVVYARVTRAYPTAALAGRIAGGSFIAEAQQKPLVQFFANNPDLDLVKDNVAVYLAGQGAKAFTGIDPADQAAVTANARSLQRVLRISSNPDTAQTLLGLGIVSATQIAALGRQQFFHKATQAGLSGTEANQAYDNSALRYAGMVSLYMRLNLGATGIWPQGIGDRSVLDVPMQQAIQADPTLTTLFGSQDYCAVSDCTSILSAAAYLCDLLLWLRNHPQGTGTALDVLDARRPDIRHLLLNCPNTDTELPYIDLVIELLADKVSPLPATTLAAAITPAQTALTVASADGFPAIPFTALIGAEIVLVTAMSGVGNTDWTVQRAQQGTVAATAATGDAVILTTAANPPWKQTPDNATAAQLSAAPVYFNLGAFSLLFDASYPQSLPYSAGLDELRAYLRQWNLPLWQLRQALLPISGALPAQQAAVAAERLGMNVHAESLVTVADFVSAEIAWNITDPRTALVSVPAFLQAASLDYESLLELLDVEWVTDGSNLGLFGVGDLCDTSLQTLTPATTLAAAIDTAQTVITVADASAFPAAPFYAGIGGEILQVTALGGTGNTSWTVARAQQGTSPAAANVGDAVVIPLDPVFLDRAHRFLRLWLSTGYKMWELDLLLNAPSIGAGGLDENALIALQAFWQVQTATGLAVDALLAFYQPLDTGAHRDPDGSTTTSLYARIFLNPTTTWIAPDADLASLPGGGAVTDPLLDDHVKAIQPALGISASDLATLIALTDNDLTLINLSAIYRFNALATASKLGVSDLLAVAKLLSPATAPATTLAAPLAASDVTLTVADASTFGPPNFYIAVGAEILLVTAMSGTGNRTWTVLRGQLGSSPAAAVSGAAVTSDSASPATALAALLASPAATLAFLAQAAAIGQASLTRDALTYVLTPPSAITGTWATTSQITPAAASATLVAIQQAVLALLSANTALASAISATDTVITVASDAGFPAANFYVYIGSEILQVTSTSGAGNATWTVLRGQQGTTAAAAAAGTVVTPTSGDLQGAVIAAVAANACNPSAAPLALDVTAAILQTLQVPGVNQPLLAVLMDPSLLAATGTLVIGGAPAAGDILQAVLGNGIAAPVTVSYTLTAADAGSVNQTAADFAAAINLSSAVTGPQAFLAPCAVSGAVITLAPLAPGLAGSSITCTGSATPGGADHATISPAVAQTIGQPAFQNQFLALQVFDKVAVLVRGLRLVASDLSWLLANSGKLAPGGLDFTQLPVTAAQPAQGLGPLLTTLLIIKLARMWKAAPPSSPVQTLYDIIGGILDNSIADETTAQIALATITGWPVADIEAFSGAIGTVFPASYLMPGTYDALRTLEAMSAAVNVAAPAGGDGGAATPGYGTQIVSWGAVPADEVSAQSMAASALGVLKAQQPTEDAWLTIAQTIMNPIRQNQSAALQSYLIAQRDGAGNLIYGDTDALFDYFLIDTQMTSCQVTSRVVQAYIAVQIFVERCLMNLEAPQVVVNLDQDDTWNQWEWMKRYRIWEANREVFLYPENWLIESQRPNRTEIYQKFEQDVRQGENTTDYLETVVMNYIDGLDGVAHLLVTGTCEDPASGTIYVVARTLADPPTFYIRSYENGAWTGWSKIPLDIKAHHVVPTLFRGRVCLFWLDLQISNEPQQTQPPMQPSGDSPNQSVDRYVAMSVYFSIFRNGNWTPAQASKGKLFDKPFYNPAQASTTQAVEALYTIKVQAPAPAPGYGANLFVDVFRLGNFDYWNFGWLGNPNVGFIVGEDNTVAVHLGRAVFDGRFSDLELRNMEVPGSTYYTSPSLLVELLPAGIVMAEPLLTHAQAAYGPDAQPLLELPESQADPNLAGEPGLTPQAGALAAFPSVGQSTTMQLNFTSASALEQNVGPLLDTVSLPLRVVGPAANLNFDPGSDFFVQDNRRCYWVESERTYWNGSAWSPTPPSNPASAPYQLQFNFHPFYHPFTRLLWNQLSAGGFDLLYDPNLQQAPDSLDAPSYSDVFSFQIGYQPTWRVQWDHASVTTALAADITNAQTTITVRNNIWVPSPGFYVSAGAETMQVTGVTGSDNTTWTVLRGQQGTVAAPAASGTAVTPLFTSQDRQFLDFSYGGAFSVYNWELFYHVPLYVAQLLSQNQQFEDAQTWFHYIFNPTRQGSEPAPQRFWIPQPLRNLTSAEIQAQEINRLLEAVNQGDPAAVAEVQNWRNDPFNPFLLADQRPVAYMKSTVMSYLDNLIAWGDNLFSTESREALSEATLLYVVASEILGPAPSAVPPPQHADASFDQLLPALDAFANAMVEIENVIGVSGGGGSGSGGTLPSAQTFYFKIPPNQTLLNYWTTVADRLFKLRNCQNIAGAPLELALFDAPIDPGLLIAAQAAGVDLSSVLSDVAAPPPNYRFTALYSQAADFVGAVRAYGASLQAALEKIDTGALALLQQTMQQQLLNDGNQILDWQVQQAQSNIVALQASQKMAQDKHDFNAAREIKPSEKIGAALHATAATLKLFAAATKSVSSVVHLAPLVVTGGAGVGGTPIATISEGGKNAGDSSHRAGISLDSGADFTEICAYLANTQGAWYQREDEWIEAAKEAQDQIDQITAQINAAQFELQVRQQQQVLHQEQIDNTQKTIDFLNDKFTSDSLYDWMVGSLSATYFQSYQLAYQMCKQVERCYRFELGIKDSSFIQFGYWDNLHKGLLAGETLNHDLRRMQASYLQQNARRFELSRFVSLGSIDPGALQSLLATGSCFFSLPESLFDNDYPGHYNRRLTRVSMTVVYPAPGKFDNVKATLTLMDNRVRVSTDTGAGYAETPVGSDPRFVYNYAAVPQKIAMGNAQDDPGLFVTAIASNIADQRYVPFENAGAISSWRLEMPQLNNEIDISTVGDVVLHLYYTALDGGGAFQQTVTAYNADTAPTAGLKIFSAQNDFAAPAATPGNPYPVTPWQAFLGEPFVLFTTLAWPIDAVQTTITVTSAAGFPAAPFMVTIGAEILQVTAVSGTGNSAWTVLRAQQGTVAAPASGATVALLPATGAQALTLSMSPAKFPPWTRGKTISVTSITVLAVSWQPPSASPPGPFVLVPIAPLPTTPITMQPVAGTTEPNICTSGAITLPPNTPLGTWSFALQLQGGTNFYSLNKNSLGDVLLLVNYEVS